MENCLLVIDPAYNVVTGFALRLPSVFELNANPCDECQHDCNRNANQQQERYLFMMQVLTRLGTRDRTFLSVNVDVRVNRVFCVSQREELHRKLLEKSCA